MWVYNLAVVFRVWDRKFNQDRVIWVGSSHRFFCCWKTNRRVDGTSTFSSRLGLWASLCVLESGCVCLVHAPYSWPLITQSILIQSASFSHDCHTLAAAMVTCRGRRESRRSERDQARRPRFNHCDIYTHTHGFYTQVSLPRFWLHEDFWKNKKICQYLKKIHAGNSHCSVFGKSTLKVLM